MLRAGKPPVPRSASPIFASEPLDAIELAQIAGHDDEPAATCMTCDQHVISANRLALPLQLRPDFGRVARGFQIERQDFEARREPLDLKAVLLRPRRFRRAMELFG